MKEIKLEKIMIFSQTKKTKDGRKYTSYSTKYAFKNEDGTRTEKYIEVKFTKDAFKDSFVDLEDIKRGILEVEGTKIGCPDKYEILVDEKTGKKTYPKCYIRGGIHSYTEILKEHEFHFASNIEDEDQAEEVSDEEIGEMTTEE